MGKSDKVEAKRLKGFQDYQPDQMRARYRVMDAVRQIAHLAGFQPVGTPALEYAEILLGKGSEETDKQVYRFIDGGERDVALRFDLTVPFARYVAEHFGEMVFPFKRMQIGDVWRAEKPQKGRFREFGQCDLDIIGADSQAADGEILLCIHRILEALDFGPFTISVGNRVVLSGLIRVLLQTKEPEGEVQTLIAIDKLAKIGAGEVSKLIAAATGAPLSRIATLLELTMSKNEMGDTDLSAVAKALGDDIQGIQAIARLEKTLASHRQLIGQEGPGRIVCDLSIARGLAYYTGIVFETTVDSLPGFGSISSGGRYNDLASRFTDHELPGVGGSIGLDRLVAALMELDQLKSPKGRGVFVAVATEDARCFGMRLADRLRSHGVMCDVDVTSSKVGKQFRHADRLGYPLVVVVGTSEMEKNQFSLKNMVTGQETKDLDADDIVNMIGQHLVFD